MSAKEKVGPFELVQPLGRGGMAETFAAIKRGPEGFEQLVCIKRVHAHLAKDEEFVRLFLGEAKLSAKLRHANIVQVVDFGIADDNYFLALEHIQGLTLRQLLSSCATTKEPVLPEFAALIAVDLASALLYAHEHVVHRDISPSNVLLSDAGEVKLTDFGIAKAMNAKGVTASGVVRGKVPYMAPEYAQRGRFTEASDIFSLGVVLYELLGGKRPFDGVDDLDTLQRALMGERAHLSVLAPNAPKGLVETIERCIAANPAARPQDAAELLDALASVAPPMTTRRQLAALVREHAKLRDGSHKKRASELGLSLTSSHASLTESLDNVARGPSRPVIAAPPSADTRTSLEALPASPKQPAEPPSQEVLMNFGHETVVDRAPLGELAGQVPPPKTTSSSPPAAPPKSSGSPPARRSMHPAVIVLIIAAIVGGAWMLGRMSAEPDPSSSRDAAMEPADR